MFAIVDALIVTKIDYLPLNPDFDMAALHEQARVLNPNLKIFEVCARTGEGVDELAAWLAEGRDQMMAS
jgi:hydrogenase nickel incorporation protein HypB